MAEHETLIHRIKAWQVANADAETTTDNEALLTERRRLFGELQKEILPEYLPAPQGRPTLATVLADLSLEGRTPEEVRSAVRAAIGEGPYPAVDNDDWNADRGWPEREWVIPGWLPLGRLGILSGRGGRGKSRLALQLAARIAAREPRLGAFVSPLHGRASAALRAELQSVDPKHCGPVVYTSWEDERDEVGRRLAALAKDGLGNRGDELRGRLRFIDLRGEGALWAPEDLSRPKQGPAHLTVVGHRVRATVEELGARLLIVDSLAGAYAADENTRALVRAFCADWDAWADRARCTVMLIAHPPKPPSGSGAGTVDRDYAGSTDWHAAARWRWTLELTPTGETGKTRAGKSISVDALALSCAKSSYGPQPDSVFLLPSESGIGWRGASPSSAADAVANEQQLTLDYVDAGEKPRIRRRRR